MVIMVMMMMMVVFAVAAVRLGVGCLVVSIGVYRVPYFFYDILLVFRRIRRTRVDDDVSQAYLCPTRGVANEPTAIKNLGGKNDHQELQQLFCLLGRPDTTTAAGAAAALTVVGYRF